MKHYSDAEAESVFGLSSSRLRTAQRLNLIESVPTRLNNRYCRVWTEISCLRVYSAEQLCTHFSIPFAAACKIILHGIVRTGNYEQVLEAIEARSDLGVPKGRGMVPAIGMVDRTHVAIRSNGEWQSVGAIVVGEDGRHDFDPTIQQLQDPTAIGVRSVTYYDPLPVIIEFQGIADKNKALEASIAVPA